MRVWNIRLIDKQVRDVGRFLREEKVEKEGFLDGDNRISSLMSVLVRFKISRQDDHY